MSQPDLVEVLCDVPFPVEDEEDVRNLIGSQGRSDILEGFWDEVIIENKLEQNYNLETLM